MKKKVIITFSIVLFFALSLGAIFTFAIFRGNGVAEGDLATAKWSVTRSQSATGDSLVVIPGLLEDEYDLTVTSTSEVDIKYKVLISNLPSGVEVALDDGSYLTPTGGSLTITNNNLRINYNDSNKTKTHIIHLRAATGTTAVENQSINIDVEFSQVV